MFCAIAGLIFAVSGGFQAQPAALLSVDYETARAHELKPHRRSIPVDGMRQGFNQLHVTLAVSPVGFVTHADATGEDKVMKHWPELQG